MSGLQDLLGGSGFLTQLVMYNVAGQAISALLDPAFTALMQDALAAHPDHVLDPQTLADLLARHMVTRAEAEADAAKSGIDPARFAALADRAKVRVPPADLATAVLRSYATQGEADAEAGPQGYDPAMMRLLGLLAGDAPGPQQLAEALRRGLIARDGRGPASTSFVQGIAESRLHDKWADMIAQLTKAIPSPPELAEALVRNFTDQATAEAQAAKSGVDPELLNLLRLLAGDAPGPQQLAEALRRGLIPAEGTGPASTSFQQGIAEGRLADKWAATIQGLAQLWPTPTDALHAEVEGQITHEQATDLYAQLGGNPDFQTWLFNAIGEGPSPLEAARLAARGIIDWQGVGPEVTSYEQAVRESRFRNKWTDAYRALAEHIPDPSTIGVWLAHQLITSEQAHDLLLKNDMAPAEAAAYVSEAEYVAISDWRGLTESSVIDMYVAQVLDADQAAQILSALHVTDRAARDMLQLADLRYYVDSINKGVQRIASLYTGRKIGVAAAQKALLSYGISPTAVERVIETWTIQAQASVKTLTPAEITSSFYYEIIDQPTAQAELQVLGYTAYDAWLLLSLRVKAALPDQPVREVAPPPPAVTPGTT